MFFGLMYHSRRSGLDRNSAFYPKFYHLWGRERATPDAAPADFNELMRAAVVADPDPAAWFERSGALAAARDTSHLRRKAVAFCGCADSPTPGKRRRRARRRL